MVSTKNSEVFTDFIFFFFLFAVRHCNDEQLNGFNWSGFVLWLSELINLHADGGFTRLYCTNVHWHHHRPSRTAWCILWPVSVWAGIKWFISKLLKQHKLYKISNSWSNVPTNLSRMLKSGSGGSFGHHPYIQKANILAVLFFSPNRLAEKVRKLLRQNFATKVRKSSKSCKCGVKRAFLWKYTRI